jgi:LacI family transcriptional regulator
MNVKQKDIAQELNISIVAVSKALNDQDGVSGELRQQVKDTALKLGYKKEILKREIARKTKNISIVIPRRQLNPKNMTQSFYLEIFETLSTILLRYDYCAILSVLEKDEEDNNIFPKLYREKKIEGIIFLGEVRKNYFKTVEQIDLPKVFVDFYSKDFKCPSVVSDNVSGSYDITKYLIDLGHRRIGFLGSVRATTSIQDRYLGYYKALLENNLEINQDWILQDRDEEGVYVSVELPKVLPDAFVCNSDRAAYGLVNVLKEKGLKVGEEISVVGFDNDIFSHVCDPQLTTCAVNISDMSRKAVEVLLNTMVNQDTLTIKTAIPGNIIYRDSVKVPRELKK